MDAPNLDISHMSRGGLHLVSYEALEEGDATAPSATKPMFRFCAAFSFLVLIGAGSAFAWRSYGGQDVIGALGSSLAHFLSSKPSAPSLTAAEIQQQLSSITLNLAG